MNNNELPINPPIIPAPPRNISQLAQTEGVDAVPVVENTPIKALPVIEEKEENSA